jgi:hypothetical protein
MQQTELSFGRTDWANLPKLAAVAVLLVGSFPSRTVAQQQGQKTFSSPEEASKAFMAAAQSNDEKTMLDILGPDGKDVVSSGDAVEDAQNRANLVRRYQEMHRFSKEPDGSVLLLIGAENWPAPIPIVKKNGSWFFDTDAGKKEILYRRVGRNEMSTIHVCEELVAAQKEYYSTQHNEYAQQIFSDDGQHNGLYWKAADGEPQSPIGPLVASAVAEGYAKGRNVAPTPYHGYYYHVLTRQGKSSSGGAKNYVVNGKMTEGFAFVAYPAEYRSSGVMTFVVGTDGTVYEKDLGKKTEALGKAMKEFNANSTWHKAVEQPEQSAGAQPPK